jgi:outer membrane protein assembly factor BamB
MKTAWIPITVPTAIAVLGVATLGVWTSTGTIGSLPRRDPGQDRTPRTSVAQTTGPVQAGEPIRGPGQPAQMSGAWPGFRGSKRDAICTDSTRLARTWPPDGPPVRWQIEVGEGYAAAAIADGCVYLIDYDAEAQADTMRCLSLADGREIWRNSYPASVAPNHGMSRTIPALAGDAVVSIGPRCHVACWDKATGQCRWLIDMVRQFGTVERQWYTGQCPLIDGQRLILAPCGPDALLVAVDLKTGRAVWKTPNPRGWLMTHSSIMLAEFAGRRMYVYCGTGGTAGVATEDGRELWHEEQWKENFATSPSPVPLPGGRLFLSSGYDDTGALLLQLEDTGGRLTAKTAYTLTRRQFGSEQQTPVLYQDHLYGVRKQSRGPLVCMDLEGKELWNSGQLRFGHGPYVIADGLVLALSEDGLLAAAEATPEAFRLVAKHQVIPKGREAWGPMALAGGQLVIRDLMRMVCVDLRAPP